MHGTIIPGALFAPDNTKVHDIVLMTSYYVERIDVKRNTHIQNQSITVDFIIVNNKYLHITITDYSQSKQIGLSKTKITCTGNWN